ncbi:ATP-binding protein [Desulfonatronum sp. SC1]|uniref:ATP-binding protein n=1 Tax=Desulfonatronum sp. SC1 TaxID=2109626 RepID=UPI001304C360|nr:ATP-binding protein [Desulfonatronum sp. SC1]
MKRIFLSYFLFLLMTMLAIQFVFGPITERLLSAYLKNDLELHYRELTRGVFHTLLADFVTIESHLWDDHIARLQPYYGFPLSLQPIESTRFSPEEKAQLLQGMIIVQEAGDRISKRVGESSYALQLGPFSDLEKKLEGTLVLYVWIAVLVFSSLLALIWAYPFWRNLKQVRTAAIAFGEGIFSTRVQVKRHSVLMPVEEAFNRMAERIEQLIDSHRELTRAVSHELRTPLARIRFCLEMHAAADTFEEQQRHMEGIRSDLGDLEAMIAELLTFFRFDGQTEQLHQEALPLVQWLREIIDYVGTEMESVHFSFRVLDDVETVIVRFEPLHMGRAVTNLLRNAVRYARDQVELTVQRDGALIRLCIDDNGPGIPEKEHERIFEPFVRLDESRSRDLGGFGLGLAIVRRVAEQHGGRAWVAQSPMGGARFIIEWPGVPPSMQY